MEEDASDDHASFSIGIITVVICGAIREAHPKCVPEKRELEINRRRLAREAEKGRKGGINFEHPSLGSGEIFRCSAETRKVSRQSRTECAFIAANLPPP